MTTLSKIRAALASRPGRMPSEAYRRAALTLWSDRALTLPESEFAALAVTLGITEHVAALERAEQASAHPRRAPSEASGPSAHPEPASGERSPRASSPSGASAALSERGAA